MVQFLLLFELAFYMKTLQMYLFCAAFFAINMESLLCVYVGVLLQLPYNFRSSMRSRFNDIVAVRYVYLMKV